MFSRNLDSIGIWCLTFKPATLSAMVIVIVIVILYYIVIITVDTCQSNSTFISSTWIPSTIALRRAPSSAREVTKLKL